MSDPTEIRLQRMRELRDAKVRPHLDQYAPVWLVDEKTDYADEALQFNVVFFHPQYAWVNRRYRFDAFNLVLYYLGQRLLSEEDALRHVVDKKPYLPAEIINTVDSYGG